MFLMRSSFFIILCSAGCVLPIKKSEPRVSSPAMREVKRVEVHGHRGARAIYPENTLSAFHYALDRDIDVLELDLGVTKDHVLVISHDPFVNPDHCQYADGKKLKSKPLINSLTLNDLQKFDCGSLSNPEFSKQVPVPGEKIPTLENLFALVKQSTNPNAKRIQFNMETKIDSERPTDTVAPDVFVKLVLKILRKHKMIDRTILQSFDYRTLIEAKKREPKLRIAALSERKDEDFVATAKRLKADVISPKWTFVTRANVEQLHKMNVRVLPWTPNKKDEWRTLISLGVDGIITDDPKELLDFLKSERLHD